MKRTLVRIGLGLSLSLAACGGATASGTSSVASTTSVADGQAVFAANCASCHGSDAISGSARINLPSVAQSSPSTVISTVENGKDQMPSFAGKLTTTQIDDVAAYLASL